MWCGFVCVGYVNVGLCVQKKQLFVGTMEVDKKMVYSTSRILCLFNFVIKEVYRLSKSTYESAFYEHERFGRGAYVIILNEGHLFHKKQFAMLYSKQKDLLMYGCSFLDNFVQTYDPLFQCVIFLSFTNGEMLMCKSYIVNRDDYQMQPVQKTRMDDKAIQTIDTSHCNYCTRTSTALKYCGKCRVTAYCSRECQLKDWSDHKPMCNTLQDLPKH